MKFCNSDGCNNPVFSNGFCRNHQYKRENYDRRSIVQRGIDKHKANPTKQIVKEQRFPKKRPGTFDESVLNENQEVASALPNSFVPPKWMEREANDIFTPYKSFNPDTDMGRWFLSIRPLLTGVCQHCGGKTMAVDKEADTKFHWSICHLFEKSNFSSICTHPENYLELCYYSPSCHKNMDDKILTLTQLNCFDDVIRKACILYPLMTIDEQRRVPKFLLHYIEIER